MPVIAKELLVFALSKFNAYTLLKSIEIDRKCGMLLPVLIHSGSPDLPKSIELPKSTEINGELPKSTL